jgi:hypothetical protein
MKVKFIAALVLLVFVKSIVAQEKPSIPAVDRIRLAEAFRLAESVGNHVWKDWNKAPFAVLVVTPDCKIHSRPTMRTLIL